MQRKERVKRSFREVLGSLSIREIVINRNMIYRAKRVEALFVLLP